ncbi:ATPase [Streptomyces avermitilis]|uniref:Regulatory protein n=2 Tax=Streptomyces avermitilis TaxID=33903 RepID=Q82P33_STRAW|nr:MULTISPECIES: ATP-binding protein [Streptomyces]KUN54783.1 ATPase [Streptomyces avermitilis]MYS96733.1 ATP-binding protein [Streptomyces sp. SID5469]OOV21864.1 ATP-binding protein [Streptomyces avermitilis]BAC68810.1 putative regulatory protein [Streptomyces avermitilis MA-4680 = NBRC 14893]BBJ48735.1 ATP-binding protein [Streptomyces avermitilis]
MSTKPRRESPLPTEDVRSLTAAFDGDLRNVTDARLAAEGFLRTLARASPPTSPECEHDVLLVVNELAANAVQYAPGPFTLRMRTTFDGVHVTLRDTSTTRPAPRPFHPSRGGGGIGWHLVQSLCTQVSVVVHPEGKDIHVFLPW